MSTSNSASRGNKLPLSDIGDIREVIRSRLLKARSSRVSDSCLSKSEKLQSYIKRGLISRISGLVIVVKGPNSSLI